MRGLSVHIGRSAVVDRISLSIDAGDRVGLIGESGGGKSMAALAALDLLPEAARRSGTVEMDGVELSGRPEREWARRRGRRVAMVFQEPLTALDPVMPVGRQIAEVVRRHRGLGRRAAGAAVRELLATVELPEPAALARRFAHQLSGGQRQRVVLAMALAGAPALLICDEPTTALDVTVQARLLELITRLVRERSMALLFISHDLAVVARTCRRVAVMYGGRIVESGPVERVFADPRHPYTAGLLAASDLAAAPPETPLPTIAGSVPDRDGFPSGCGFRDRCNRALAACAAVPPLRLDGPDRHLACVNPVGGR